MITSIWRESISQISSHHGGSELCPQRSNSLKSVKHEFLLSSRWQFCFEDGKIKVDFEVDDGRELHISCKFQREFPFSFFPGGKDTVIDPAKGGKGQFGRRFLDKWWRLLGNLCDPKTESKFRWHKKEVLHHQYSALHSLMFFLNREWSYSAKHDHLEHNPQQKARVGRGER